MPRHEIDETGNKYGKWEVLEITTPANDGRKRWMCRCACGTVKPVIGTQLRIGNSSSCGCSRNKHPFRAGPARRERTQSQKIASRRNKLKRYGVTIEKYNQMFEAQNGVCAICGEASNDKSLAVDHDHQTKVVRGLLCISCNLSIGHARDSIEILQKAIEYLMTTKYSRRVD